MKSQVRINAERDASYRPYCLRCPGLVRMNTVGPFHWRCTCGAVHDERLPSLFALRLASLLYETNLFERDYWALYLGVERSKIDDWLEDRDIPRASNLSMITIVLEESSDVNKAPLEAFYEMCRARATDVSPHGARMLPTVDEYRNRLIFSELSSRLAKLSPEEQGKLLLELYPEASACESMNDLTAIRSENGQANST